MLVWCFKLVWQTFPAQTLGTTGWHVSAATPKRWVYIPNLEFELRLLRSDMQIAKSEVLIRRAVPGEAAVLSNIARASKSYWGYSSQQIELWRDDLSFTVRSIEAHATFVAEVDDVQVGVVQINTTTEPWDLEALWVHPDSIGRGIGKALLGKALTMARGAGQGALSIDPDPYAEAFYLAFGAVRVGERPAPIAGEADRVRPKLWLSINGNKMLPLCRF